MRKLLAVLGTVVVGGAVLVLDPAGLFGDDTTYHASEAAMRAAVEGTWELRMPEATVTFTLRQSAHEQRRVYGARSHGWIRSAAACGSRSLIRSASACIDESVMPLDIELVAGSPAERASAEFVVYGRREIRGNAALYVRFGATLLEAELDEAGTATRVSLTGDTNATLVRTKR